MSYLQDKVYADVTIGRYANEISYNAKEKFSKILEDNNKTVFENGTLKELNDCFVLKKPERNFFCLLVESTTRKTLEVYSFYPDSPNNAHFSSTILEEGEVRCTINTLYTNLELLNNFFNT